MGRRPIKNDRYPKAAAVFSFSLVVRQGPVGQEINQSYEASLMMISSSSN